jgi:hypothetical protein
MLNRCLCSIRTDVFIGTLAITLSISSTILSQNDIIWVEKDGIVAAEVERLDVSGWSLETAPEGYTGTGYLKYTGGSSVMEIKFLIENEGCYDYDVRNHHKLQDGDNDVWRAWGGGYVKVGDCRPNTFAYLWYQKINHCLKKGIHTIRFKGRSGQFGLDRVILYRRGLGDIARDSSYPESEFITDASGHETVPNYAYSTRVARINATSFSYQGSEFVDVGGGLAVKEGADSAEATTTWNHQSGTYDIRLYFDTEEKVGRARYKLFVDEELWADFHAPTDMIRLIDQDVNGRNGSDSVYGWAWKFEHFCGVQIDQGATITLRASREMTADGEWSMMDFYPSHVEKQNPPVAAGRGRPHSPYNNRFVSFVKQQRLVLPPGNRYALYDIQGRMLAVANTRNFSRVLARVRRCTGVVIVRSMSERGSPEAMGVVSKRLGLTQK